MIDKIREYINRNRMLDKEDRVVVGVSGGADSVALLEMLYELSSEYRLSLYVVHVNHGIRKEAGDDAEYVKQICSERNIPFYLFEENIVKLAKDKGMSVEEMGRVFRYRCFADVCDEVGAAKIAVAHHMDDQVETVLFHMARGTDVAGAAGMRPVSGILPSYVESYIGNDCNEAGDRTPCPTIIRPLLCVDKKEICGWLEKRGVSWKEDVTNSDNDYARNRIRNVIVPELKLVNAGASGHIADFAMRAFAYDEYIKEQAWEYIKRENTAVDLREARGKTGGRNEEDGEFEKSKQIGADRELYRIDRNHLLRQKRILADRILYEMIIGAGHAKKDVTSEHVELTYGLLGKQSGRRIDLPYGVCARISYEWLIIERQRETGKALKDVEAKSCKVYEGVNDASYEQEVDVAKLMADGQVTIPLDEGMQGQIHMRILTRDKISQEELKNFEKNYTKYFDCDKIGNTLHIRHPKTEDYIVVDVQGHRKKLRKLFKDDKLPADRRDKQIVIAMENEILMVVGGRRCESYRVEDVTENILEVRCEGEDYGLSH